MSFSAEWDAAYRNGTNNSIWPWTELISRFYRYFPAPQVNYERLNVLELGCGAGANIPFFESLGVNYYAIEGSSFEALKLQERFSANSKITIVEGDFTKGIPFDKKFQLIFDRASVSHNTTEDIKNTISRVYSSLEEKGYFIGVNWFATKEPDYLSERNVLEKADDRTYRFSSGIYGGLGNAHFTDETELRSLLAAFEIKELYLNIEQYVYPKELSRYQWSFVAQKGKSSG